MPVSTLNKNIGGVVFEEGPRDEVLLQQQACDEDDAPATIADGFDDEHIGKTSTNWWTNRNDTHNFWVLNAELTLNTHKLWVSFLWNSW